MKLDERLKKIKLYNKLGLIDDSLVLLLEEKVRCQRCGRKFFPRHIYNKNGYFDFETLRRDKDNRRPNKVMFLGEKCSNDFLCYFERLNTIKFL